jgi:hypothetical protein
MPSVMAVGDATVAIPEEVFAVHVRAVALCSEPAPTAALSVAFPPETEVICHNPRRISPFVLLTV